MTMFSIGDKVSVLDDDINGVVISIKNKEISIETNDGFTMTFFVNELIKIKKLHNAAIVLLDAQRK